MPTKGKAKRAGHTSGPRPEYEFRGGVRGKHAAAYARRTNLVRLEPDVARAFPTSGAVNRALRALAGTLRLVGHLPSR